MESLSNPLKPTNKEAITINNTLKPKGKALANEIKTERSPDKTSILDCKPMSKYYK